MDHLKLNLNYKNLLVIAGLALVITLIYKIQAIISIFAVSFFIAYLLDPVIDRLETIKVPRSLGILILIIVLGVLLAIASVSIFPILYSEVKYLADSTPKIIESVTNAINHFAVKANVDISIDAIKDQLAPKAGEIAKEALNAIEGIFTSATSALSSVVNLAIIPILVFYFLKDFDRLNDKLFATIEKNSDKNYKRYLLDFDKILSVYFRGQVIVAMILGVLYTVVLLVCGVKPAILIGMVSGVLSIVPYLGFIIGFATSIVLAIVQYQDVLHPLMVVAGFTIVQLLEGNLITPKIVGESLGLHPTAVIFALLAGGSLLGIGGMIIALPIAAFIKILVQEQLA